MAKDTPTTTAVQHLQAALDAGYQLGQRVPLIPVGAPLRPELMTQDGEMIPALDPAHMAFGKTPGTVHRTHGYWSRRSAWNSTSITPQDVVLHDLHGCNLGLKTGIDIVAFDADITD